MSAMMVATSLCCTQKIEKGNTIRVTVIFVNKIAEIFASETDLANIVNLFGVLDLAPKVSTRKPLPGL